VEERREGENVSAAQGFWGGNVPSPLPKRTQSSPEKLLAVPGIGLAEFGRGGQARWALAHGGGQASGEGAQAMYLKAISICENDFTRHVLQRLYEDEVRHERELLEQYNALRPLVDEPEDS
jgi:hypothetical protein